MILREPMNGLTHATGALLALIGTIILFTVTPSVRHGVTFAIFGAGMILLYTTSTLYHWLPVSPKAQKVWRRLDHSMIFVFIAATYTPVCLIALKGLWGWWLFGIVWGMALAGLCVKIFWMDAPRMLSTSLYVGMGWVAVFAFYPLYHALPLPALLWLIAGGVFYTLGAVFYAIKRPKGGRFFGFHEIFHIFVMLGSACHFWLMFRYISHILV